VYLFFQARILNRVLTPCCLELRPSPRILATFHFKGDTDS
jgi:hypothetical protein